MPELEAAAHRQGFAALCDVEHAILEPGGTICFFAKQPPPDELRHRQIVERLDRLTRELAQLRANPAAPES